MADIFFSYKHEDRAAVEPLVRLLEAQSYVVWWDPTIVPGERFDRVIRRALDDAACVIVAWSRLSVESHWVQDEAGLARDRRVLVPVSIDGAEPPLGFRQLQTVNLADWDGQSDDPRVGRLLAGIGRLVGARGDPTKPASDGSAGTGEARKPDQRAAYAGKIRKTRAGKIIGVWWAPTAILVASTVVVSWLAAAVFFYLNQPQEVKVRTPVGPVPVERSFQDCVPGCPRMIVVPTGSFLMGSPDAEPQRGNDEGPQRQVVISKVLAVGKFPVTFDEWDYCHLKLGCADLFPSDNNWGRGTHPVINVSWEDAQLYVAWLSKETGQTYRLLTEAEREYIARAGTTTPFWWGDRISTKQANYDGTKKYTDEPTGIFRQETMPVDALAPNPWGFYQVSGNTWDWVEDCYHDSYEGGAPTNGAAWATGDCSHRVLRGGSWGSQPRNVRSAARWKQPIETREPYYGFRVARICDSACNF